METKNIEAVILRARLSSAPSPQCDAMYAKAELDALRERLSEVERERDEARETARLVADALDDDCIENGYGRYGQKILAACARALAYPRGGG